MAITQHQTPDQDQLHRLTVPPSEIRVGDWMRDLGRLRQVKCIELVEENVPPSTMYTIYFADQLDEGYPTLGVREVIPVTIWREP